MIWARILSITIMSPTQDTPTVTSPSFPSPEPAKKGRRLPWPWILAVVLLIGLVVSIWLWKPWQPNIKTSERTITVTGETTVTAEPDEYIFTPMYEFTGTDKTATQAQLTDKANEVTTKLKSLGVPDSKIKNNSSDYGDYYSPDSSGSSTYYLSLTITVDDKTLAQKVQDYLLTTNPSGSITPEVTFSTAKQKTLENQARDQAEKDARAKADQSAKNLGFKVDTVKSVQDGNFNSYGGCSGGFCPLSAGSNLENGAQSISNNLTLQPGENDLPYSVQVVYYIH